MANLKNQRIVILGGSSGIGLAAARLFVTQGAEVIIGSRSAEKVEQAITAINASNVQGQAVDTTSRENVRAFFTNVGKFDHLVLTLGDSKGLGEFRTLDLDDVRAGFEVKFFGHLLAAQESLEFLRQDGSITFITAASARTSYVGVAGIGAINGALETIIPGLALELKPLRVNAVSPGVVDTAWWSGFPAEARAGLFAQTAASLPVGRVGQPEDIAEVIALLVSNSNITGSIFECDGGARIK
jgi:NAD(P)-dependent dehydrogenase (short-subunit alcohol dehydrogenase family)